MDSSLHSAGQAVAIQHGDHIEDLGSASLAQHEFAGQLLEQLLLGGLHHAVATHQLGSHRQAGFLLPRIQRLDRFMQQGSPAGLA